MNVLVIGGGGREHALAWKLAQSPEAETVYCAPGSPGMGGIECVNITDHGELAEFAATHDVGLTVVGPEVPLCEGIVNVFRDRGLRIFGPDKVAAQLEGSKTYAKEFMSKYGIPTAEAACFTNAADAVAYIEEKGAPIVVKADGLAAGKGVIVAQAQEEAIEAAESCFEGVFGAAGSRVVVEECLIGEEASILAFCDGTTIVPLDSSQDHKRVGEGDTGLNTGGMGAYSPAPVMTEELWAQVQEQVLDRFLKGCQDEGLYFRGVIYAGVMVTAGGLKVLEFNVRFGDPETQAVLPRMKSDLLEAMVATADGRLADVSLEWHDEAAVCVVMASGGYPGSYEKGFAISGLDEAEATGALVFHAGTDHDGTSFVNTGGRVLGVTALGGSIAEAVEKAYRGVGAINWEGAFYRRDIAHRALNR